MGSRAQTVSMIATAFLLAAFLLLAGCFGREAAEPVAEAELIVALKNTKAEWLKPCDGMPPELPENQTGNLLEDFNTATSLGAECKLRHSNLVDYIAPLIERAKVTSPQ